MTSEDLPLSLQKLHLPDDTFASYNTKIEAIRAQEYSILHGTSVALRLKPETDSRPLRHDISRPCRHNPVSEISY